MARVFRIEKEIPNLITLSNLFCGFMGILYCANQDLPMAAIMIFAGAVCDVFDGLAARLLKVTSPIGKQLDSLADAVTFGVLPAFILHKILFHFATEDWMQSMEIGYTPLFSLLPFLIAAGAVYRLAKFNIDDEQETYFKGLPSPASAMFVASLPLIGEYDIFILKDQAFYLNSIVLNPYLIAGVSIALPWLMMSSVPLFSLKLKSYKIADNKMLFGFLIFSAVLLVLLFWAAIPLILITYIITSLIIKPAKNKNEIQSTD